MSNVFCGNNFTDYTEVLFMKKLFAILSFVTLIYIMSVVFANSVMNDLSQNIIRLHIVANSDSEIDQNIKLKIRDEILRADINIDDFNSAAKNIHKIETLSNSVLSENGFSYGAVVNLGNFKFPEKKYDQITLPSGNYNGINVILGEGVGKNWWCVLSPPSCIMDKTVKFDENPLKNTLNKQTFAVISGDFKYKFKLFDFVKNLF